MKNTQPIPEEIIEKKIFLIRGQKVMLSTHLAALYRVETRVLNQAVRRNMTRFPSDFMFQLSDDEVEWVVSQNVIPHRKYFGGALPYAFTEQGVAMLSSVLNSERAVQVNIAIMRAFVKLRELISSHKELLHKLEELERRIESHDSEIEIIFDAIHKLMEPEVIEKPKRKIGFQIEEPKQKYFAKKKSR